VSRHRFCCPEAQRIGDDVRIEGAVAAQIRRVLRLRPGDQVILFGADEWEYVVRLERVEAAAAHGTVLCRQPPVAEPRCELTLAMALLKGEKTDWALQKGTELGVSRFLLLHTCRTVAFPDEQRAAGRLQRYERIVREATEQCGRLRPPEVQGILPFEPALQMLRGGRVLILHECAEQRLGHLLSVESAAASARRALCTSGSLAIRSSIGPLAAATLLVGPEGGFTDEEVARAVAHGARPASLGPRILRAETAALAAVALAVEALEGSLAFGEPGSS
jgi:16S rRNA (uracil1498-N3)-methyltransferase